MSMHGLSLSVVSAIFQVSGRFAYTMYLFCKDDEMGLGLGTAIGGIRTSRNTNETKPGRPLQM